MVDFIARHIGLVQAPWPIALTPGRMRGVTLAGAELRHDGYTPAPYRRWQSHVLCVNRVDPHLLTAGSLQDIMLP